MPHITRAAGWSGVSGGKVPPFNSAFQVKKNYKNLYQWNQRPLAPLTVFPIHQTLLLEDIVQYNIPRNVST